MFDKKTKKELELFAKMNAPMHNHNETMTTHSMTIPVSSQYNEEDGTYALKKLSISKCRVCGHVEESDVAPLEFSKRK